MDLQLKGRVAMITSPAKGMGAAITKAFAAEGAKLTHFNTPLPFCAPTRASLMTGRYPFRCGLSQNPAPDGGR